MKTTILLFLLILSTTAYSQTHQDFEYLSMTQVDYEIKLNKDSESFETINVKDEMSKDFYDYRPFLKRIQEYEKQGWEIVFNNVYGQGMFPRNYVLMKRKK
tara:strand:+ start:434 stop:736 length:303 start_codon:yes stop_codon:yes gene_type:complete